MPSMETLCIILRCVEFLKKKHPKKGQSVAMFTMSI